ncbi:unnamed protein product [Didymodactylos carnosus]|uniref:Ig-like domain-containing protein n=1 Tax=Didymodactylos carnosus TaxID=1234261 RepID=A0A816CIA5_9BILA|nr:unnamed protein product [Didymodactylos carnosus]CAF4518171.1 unnamed protein product [Didymodactylos carnosus]
MVIRFVIANEYQQSIVQQDPQSQYGYDRYPYQRPQYPSEPSYPYSPPQQQQPQWSQPRVDVYIFGPDDGAKVSDGQSIYFDCEVVAPYQQNVQPRWTRQGNQPLPYKARSAPLEGNRKIVRLTIPDASSSDAGRYECNAGTGNAADSASIDLQVTAGGQYPRPAQPAQPAQPYNPYGDQSGYNQQYPYYPGGYNYPQQPQQPPQPQPNYPYDSNYQPAQPQPPAYDPYNQPGYPYSNENPQQPPNKQPESPPAQDANDDDSDTNEDEDDAPEAAKTTVPAPVEPAKPSAPEPADDAATDYDEGYDDEMTK